MEKTNNLKNPGDPVNLYKINVGECYIDKLSNKEVIITSVIKQNGEIQILGKIWDEILKEHKSNIEFSQGQLVYGQE